MEEATERGAPMEESGGSVLCTVSYIRRYMVSHMYVCIIGVQDDSGGR
jgi:hypothetical protein